MSQLPNCLLIVTAEVDAEVEADWSRWYDEVHLPDALACPGVLAGPALCLRRRDLRKRPRPGPAHPRPSSGRRSTSSNSPAAVETKEFEAMRGWGRFAPHVRSQTRVVDAGQIAAGRNRAARRALSLHASPRCHDPRRRNDRAGRLAAAGRGGHGGDGRRLLARLRRPAAGRRHHRPRHRRSRRGDGPVAGRDGGSRVHDRGHLLRLRGRGGRRGAGAHEDPAGPATGGARQGQEPGRHRVAGRHRHRAAGRRSRQGRRGDRRNLRAVAARR